MINALIIDDEKHCSDNLLWQLNKYCPEVEVQAICKNAGEALEPDSHASTQAYFPGCGNAG